MKLAQAVGFSVVVGAGLWAQQPVVRPEGVRNAASRIPGSLPGGGLAAGSRVAIEGSGFGADLGRVRVEAGGRPVRAVSVQPEVIQVVWPAGWRGGELRVTVSGAASRAVRLPDGSGGPGLYPVEEAAAPGGVLTLTGTGVAPAKVWVGLEPAAVLGVTARPDGLQQWRIRIPPNAPPGCAVPVTAASAGGAVGNTISIAVARPGRPCTPDAWSQAVGQPGRIGLLILSTSIHASRETQEGAALLAARPAGQAWAVPVPGTCGIYRVEEGFDARDSIVNQLTGRMPGDGLDGGSRIVVSAGGQARGLTARAPGFYSRRLEGQPLSGKALFSSLGGPGVGEFSMQMDAPARFTASLPATQSVVRRDAGLTLSWSGVAPGRWMALAVTASDPANAATATAVCLAPAAAGRFTLPGWLLGALPRADSAGVSLTSVPAGPDVRWSARGLDRGVGAAVFSHSTVVALQ